MKFFLTRFKKNLITLKYAIDIKIKNKIKNVWMYELCFNFFMMEFVKLHALNNNKIGKCI